MGHYYDKNGSPMHNITMTNGNVRPTTSRDAKRLGLVPSVSTIISLLAKDLDNYKTNQILDAVCEYGLGEHDRMPGWANKEWRDKIKQIVNEKRRAITTRGTKYHLQLERLIKGEHCLNNCDICIVGSIQEIENTLNIEFNPVDFISEFSFSHSLLGFGGCVDIHSKVHNVIIDFKTKDGNLKPNSLIYNEHKMQLAAYREGIGMGNAKCYNLFTDISTGQSVIVEHKESDLVLAFEQFCLLTKLFYKLKGL